MGPARTEPLEFGGSEMTVGSPGSEHHRGRFALLFLVIGLLLVLFAWLSWIGRVSAPDDGPPVSVRSAMRVGDRADLALDGLPFADQDRRREAAVRIGGPTLMVGLLLTLLFLGGSLVIVRATRRYQAATSRRRGPPTANDDVWSMHKLPNESDEQRG